ncbi:MAG: cyclase family protein [Oscillospiraceae bacterium]|nr:cyclase family protein [Oscillospiraceae bacterium]
MFKVKRCIDLSWPLAKDTPIYPGDPAPNIEAAATIERDGYNLSRLVLGSHTGTHVDAPYHFLSTGETIDQIGLDRFFGEALLIPVPGKGEDEAITLADIADFQDKITADKILIIRTGWDKYAGTEKFFHHPYLSAELAKFIVGRGVRFFCIDTLTVDGPGTAAFPVHHLFFESRMIIGENLRGLDAVDFENLVLAAFPLGIAGADGSPVRALAMEIE